MSDYVGILLSDRQGFYLNQLAATGLYGENRDHVVSSLVGSGLREAHERGLLDIKAALPTSPEATPAADDEMPF